MVAFRVQNAKDYDAVPFDAIEKFVRESPRKRTSKTAIVNRSFGIFLQQIDRAADFLKKFISQTDPLSFIP